MLVLDEEIGNHEFIRIGLEEAYGNEAEILIKAPLSTKDEMIFHIQSYGDKVSALIFDERLTETGDCDYQGSELAEAYRLFNSKIPIYILTSYPDSVDEESGDIEYVIDKSDLTEHDKIDKLAQKLRRHINIYKDIIDQRKVRLHELILKQTEHSLSPIEATELKNLQFWRTLPIGLEESIFSEEMKASLDAKENILIELEELLGNKN